jgi:hypothetical protein
MGPFFGGNFFSGGFFRGIVEAVQDLFVEIRSFTERRRF